MTQDDLNTLLAIVGILLALSIGLIVILVATAFAGGLLIGRAHPRA